MRVLGKVLLLLLAAADAAFAFVPHKHTKNHLCSVQSAVDDADTAASVQIPPFVTSPVLEQVYPALIAHKGKYGNPNIPLGSADGKRCKTLRRLHFQNKLTGEEAAHLTDLGFRFHSFEDVYYECDFEEMLQKLMEYQKEHQTFQIPKKYELDPELGAWVTMLRRLKQKDDLPEDQVSKLDAVEFEWISTRKCGSSFMKKYREVLEKLTEAADVGGDAAAAELLSSDAEIKKWVDAQRQVHGNGKLSESRIQYMADLPGVDWMKEV
mmetsp:Transcript_21667/g.35745  ORF Transcript_21667/g.35745 Transcript_21667/m.35745 type:complete len:266 (+) Transcript_21667:102-899(+)